MNLAIVIGIGLVLGVLGSLGILWVPEEPYRYQVIAASTLKSILVSLLTGLTLSVKSPWWHGLGYGALYGLCFGLVVFLSKGGPKSKDAPYVLPVSILTGAITGVLLIWLAF